MSAIHGYGCLRSTALAALEGPGGRRAPRSRADLGDALGNRADAGLQDPGLEAAGRKSDGHPRAAIRARAGQLTHSQCGGVENLPPPMAASLGQSSCRERKENPGSFRAVAGWKAGEGGAPLSGGAPAGPVEEGGAIRPTVGAANVVGVAGQMELDSAGAFALMPGASQGGRFGS